MVGFAVRGRYFFLNEKNEKERAKRKCDTAIATSGPGAASLASARRRQHPQVVMGSTAPCTPSVVCVLHILEFHISGCTVSKDRTRKREGTRVDSVS